jgi:hypothetical protein
VLVANINKRKARIKNRLQKRDTGDSWHFWLTVVFTPVHVLVQIADVASPVLSSRAPVGWADPENTPREHVPTYTTRRWVFREIWRDKGSVDARCMCPPVILLLDCSLSSPCLPRLSVSSWRYWISRGVRGSSFFRNYYGYASRIRLQGNRKRS